MLNLKHVSNPIGYTENEVLCSDTMQRKDAIVDELNVKYILNCFAESGPEWTWSTKSPLSWDPTKPSLKHFGQAMC